MEQTTSIPLQDLPLWMRRARRGADWGVLLSMAFALLAAWSFIAQPDLPRTASGENYVYQTANLAAAIAEGRLYPRWSPDALGGYGAPIPHYYPHGGAYAAALVQFFLTGDPVAAVRSVYVLWMILAGAAAYALAARWLGAPGGVLACLLLLYSPYIGLTAPRLLGDLPAFAAVAYSLVALWALDRVLDGSNPIYSVWLTLAFALLMLTHIGTAAVAAALCLGYILMNVVRRRCAWRAALISISLGFSAAACFWLPALLEQDVVTWRAAEGFALPTRDLPSLLALPRPVDPGAFIAAPETSLGMPILLCAGLAFAYLIVQRQRLVMGGAFALYFLGAGAVLAALCITVAASEMWLLGMVTLCVALGGSSALLWKYRIRERWQTLWMPLLGAVCVGLSLPIWVSPPQTQPILDTSPRAQLNYERNGFGIAALPPGAPVPTTVSLPLNSGLLAGYESGSISKIIPDMITSAVRVGAIAHGTHSDSFQISLADPTALEVLTAYFPGWTATLNNRDIGVTRSENTGLLRITFASSAVGELNIRLETTPIRLAAWAITWASLALLMIVAIRQGQRIRQQPPATQTEIAYLTPAETRLVTLTLVICAAVILWLQIAQPLRPASGYQLQQAVRYDARADVGLRLLAFEIDEREPQRQLSLTLYWQTDRPLTQNYRVNLLLLSLTDGTAYRLTAPTHPGGIPTRRWTTGSYITDRYIIILPDNLPPGGYSPALTAAVCDPTCGATLFFAAPDGSGIGNEIVLPALLTVTAS